jgi:hypothetical protein
LPIWFDYVAASVPLSVVTGKGDHRCRKQNPGADLFFFGFGGRRCQPN